MKLEVVLTKAKEVGCWHWKVVEDGAVVAHSEVPRDGVREAASQAAEWLSARETFQEYRAHQGADGRVVRGPEPM